ncbi:MAG: polyphenol oxidase family protein [Deltaproteobacteria bacterium]|jgi:YfiH family protein|nr:polyphenol oxidase family protein [Deltaproteobacteria bacterium]
MLRHEKDGLAYYSFPILDSQPRLRHMVLAGHGPGGGSQDLSFDGDGKDRALGILKAAGEALGLPPPAPLGQIHGDRLLALRKGEENDPSEGERPRQGYDAVMGWPGQGLMVRLADCQGIILYHPESDTLALAHSGWRGSALDIIGKTVKAMERERGADPKGIIACVSPSIGPCCMEFRDWKSLLPEEAWAFLGEGDHMDFWAMTAMQLERAGIRKENTEMARTCTRCDPNFFSHRRGDKGRFGVIAGVLP